MKKMYFNLSQISESIVVPVTEAISYLLANVRNNNVIETNH